MGGAKESSAERVRRHRAKLRAAGLRPVQLWVPDTRSDTFRKRYRQECDSIRSSSQAQEDQAFVDEIGDYL